MGETQTRLPVYESPSMRRAGKHKDRFKPPGFFTRLHRMILTPLWRPGSKDLFFFCLGLRSTIDAGVPVIQAFEIMAQSVRHRLLQKASLAISRDLSAGFPIEASMRDQQKILSPFFLNVFFAGLRSGSLVSSLDILVNHYSCLMDLKAKIMNVIIYPLFNLIAGTFIMIGRDLIILFMNHAFNWPEAMPVIMFYCNLTFGGLFAAFIVSRVAKDRRVRPVTDNVIVHLPVLGKFYKQYALAIFFQLFATGIEAGRNIRDGFRDALEGMNNYYLAGKLRAAERYLVSGEKISEAFYLTGVFDPQALSMVAAGEVSGSIPEISKRLADFYRSEVINLLPGYIRAGVPAMTILVAIAFFFNVAFLSIATFFACVLLFMAI